MSRRIRIFQVDAFTTERFTGNPAGVVLDADGLTDAEMLAIARELNNADTAFVLQPDGNATRLIVRTRGAGKPNVALAPIGALLFEPAHFIMERGMMLGIKRRAEGSTAG